MRVYLVSVIAAVAVAKRKPHKLGEDGKASGLLTNELLDRFIVVPEHKLLFCQIENNACTVFNELFLRVRHEESPPPKENDLWSRNSPRLLNMSKTDLEDIMVDQSWHKAVFYREPSERFIAAYDSKCLPGHDPDRVHCRRAFGDKSGVPFEKAVCKLAMLTQERAEMNDVHFMHQHRFCGGLLRTLEYYNTVEQLDHQTVRDKVRRLLGTVGVEPTSVNKFDTLFPPVDDALPVGDAPPNATAVKPTLRSGRPHATASSSGGGKYHARHLQSKYLANEDAVDIIVRHFAPDYHLFRMPTPSFGAVDTNETAMTPLPCSK